MYEIDSYWNCFSRFQGFFPPLTSTTGPLKTRSIKEDTDPLVESGTRARSGAIECREAYSPVAFWNFGGCLGGDFAFNHRPNFDFKDLLGATSPFLALNWHDREKCPKRPQEKQRYGNFSYLKLTHTFFVALGLLNPTGMCLSTCVTSLRIWDHSTSSSTKSILASPSQIPPILWPFSNVIWFAGRPWIWTQNKLVKKSILSKVTSSGHSLMMLWALDKDHNHSYRTFRLSVWLSRWRWNSLFGFS